MTEDQGKIMFGAKLSYGRPILAKFLVLRQTEQTFFVERYSTILGSSSWYVTKTGQLRKDKFEITTTDPEFAVNFLSNRLDEYISQFQEKIETAKKEKRNLIELGVMLKETKG